MAGLSYDSEKGDALGAALAIGKPFESKGFCEKIKSILEGGTAVSSEMAAPAVDTASPSATVAAAPAASILQSPPPRETAAVPAFRPTNPSALLPESDAPSSTGLNPPALPTVPPSSLLPAEEQHLHSPEPARDPLAPPPLPGGATPAASPGSSGALTPPPLPAAALDEAPQTIEYATPLQSSSGAESARRTPLIIPSPSSEPGDFPVKELLQRPAASSPTPESELEMASPEYIQQASETPDFALDPENDYLARALNGSRKWRKPAAAASSPEASAQMEYIRQLSSEVIERIAWEVVPELAEIIVKEALAKQGQ